MKLPRKKMTRKEVSILRPGNTIRSTSGRNGETNKSQIIRTNNVGTRRCLEGSRKASLTVAIVEIFATLGKSSFWGARTEVALAKMTRGYTGVCSSVHPHQIRTKEQQEIITRKVKTSRKGGSSR